MPEQLDLFDAGNGGDQSAKPTLVRQLAVTRRKLASEPSGCKLASSPSTYIWRTGDGEHTPPSPAGIKPTQFADSEQHAAAVDLVIANLGAAVLGQATPEQNTAYRTGRCTDCRTVRYSPGRPRCNHCHAVRIGRFVTASGVI